MIYGQWFLFPVPCSPFPGPRFREHTSSLHLLTRGQLVTTPDQCPDRPALSNGSLDQEKAVETFPSCRTTESELKIAHAYRRRGHKVLLPSLSGLWLALPRLVSPTL